MLNATCNLLLVQMNLIKPLRVSAVFVRGELYDELRHRKAAPLGAAFLLYLA